MSGKQSGLIIDRRQDETIEIGENIRITILRVGNDSKRVRMRIEAPRDMKINDPRLEAGRRAQDAAVNKGMKPGADVPNRTSAA